MSIRDALEQLVNATTTAPTLNGRQLDALAEARRVLATDTVPQHSPLMAEFDATRYVDGPDFVDDDDDDDDDLHTGDPDLAALGYPS